VLELVSWICSVLACLQEKLGNIWYFSTRFLPLFTVEYRKELYDAPSIDSGIVVLSSDATREKL
jgi:hypothetical protein